MTRRVGVERAARWKGELAGVGGLTFLSGTLLMTVATFKPGALRRLDASVRLRSSIVAGADRDLFGGLLPMKAREAPSEIALPVLAQEDQRHLVVELLVIADMHGLAGYVTTGDAIGVELRAPDAELDTLRNVGVIRSPDPLRDRARHAGTASMLACVTVKVSAATRFGTFRSTGPFILSQSDQ